MDGIVGGEVGATERRSLRGGKRSRRRWSAATKAAIVAESFVPGVALHEMRVCFTLGANLCQSASKIDPLSASKIDPPILLRSFARAGSP